MTSIEKGVPADQPTYAGRHSCLQAVKIIRPQELVLGRVTLGPFQPA